MGETLAMPHSRPMRAIELRIRDDRADWRIIYRVDPDAIVILDVFAKTTRKTPDRVIADCRRRLQQYDQTK